MGRMKSLGYAYAEYLGDGVDVDWYFESIVNGEIEIPKWFVEEWIEANPIFASEDSETFESRGESGPSWPDDYGYDNPNDYEVIMVNVGHTMERDGETIVFGDVVFGLPNDRRSRISSYGQGADKASARQALIDRATDYLQEEEFNVEENFNSSYDRRMPAPPGARCGITGLPYQSWQAGSADGVCPLVVENPSATTEDIEDWIAWMATNYSDWYPRLRGAIIEINEENFMLRPEDLEVYNAEGNSMLKNLAKVADKESNYYRSRPNPDLSEIAAELRGQTRSDKKITLTHTQLIGVMCSSYKAGRQDILDNFDKYREWNAETKSWRMQKRDSKGRFTKGFVEEIDIGQFMEMEPEEIPLMPPYTYSPEEVVEFINDCINMDDFPEQLMNSAFLDYLQQITASADLELLEGLSNAAHTSLIENGIYDDRAGMAAAKRAIFVTDVFLNFKWGQENWAAEDE